MVTMGSRIKRRYDLLKLGDQSIFGGGILIVDDELQCRAPFAAVDHLLSEIEIGTIHEARVLLEYDKVVAGASDKGVRPASIDDECVLTVTANELVRTERVGCQHV